MSRPLVFNIQKFSTHDGDGVRTTLFFKGCPLRCQWCHNPESQRPERELVFHRHKCTLCGACAAKCPQGANRIENGTLIFDREKCTACGICADWCITEAREIAGEEYTPAELVKEVMKDRIFYEQSGGGVTLSGGEVMSVSDFDFVVDVCRRLKREGVRVFIDTSGFAPWERFEKLLPYADVFLYDIKLLDPDEHRKWIGVDNQRIRDNLIRLSRAGAGIYIRIPVIRGVNANDSFMQDVISFLKEEQISFRQINLLPYHDIGKGKYSALDRVYEEESLGVPQVDEMEHYKGLFVEAGFSRIKTGG